MNKTVKAKILVTVPEEDIICSGFSVIPEIETVINRGAWNQPLRSVLSFHTSGPGVVPREIKAVYMSKPNMDLLAEYNTTLPSGVYPGKMWKCLLELAGHQEYHLCWYEDSLTNPGLECSVQHCPIILHEVIQLLNPEA